MTKRKKGKPHGQRNHEGSGVPADSVHCADASDAQLADDLRDTLQANLDRCVGMAANMIGVSKRVIVFVEDGACREMFNPVILKKSEPYVTEEGCLSLDGTRSTRRFKKIKVQWQMRDMKLRTKNFADFTAQIIQHEADHLDGILI